MFTLLRRIFSLFCDHHFTINLAGFPIVDDAGKLCGHVDRVCFGRRSVRLEGWSLAEQVGIGTLTKTNWQKPDVKRTDVTIAHGLDESRRVGFNLVWFGEDDTILVSFKTSNTTLKLMCPKATRAQELKAQLRIRLSFVKNVFLAAPMLCRAYFYPSAGHISQAKRALGLHTQSHFHVIDGRFLEPSYPVKFVAKISLVMPVFNAFDVLCDALERIAKNTELEWRLILIEDCSTDKRIRPMLRKWQADQTNLGNDVTLIENTKNLGFIGSTNRGFRKALEFKDHVVLINSDALVPPNWSQRLLYPIMNDADIASVTPLSSDAEILTAPIICQRSDLSRAEGDVIDSVISKTVASTHVVITPTGVGFCMAINRKYLGKLPQFDPVFGKGYGEEVDWCRRAKALGGRHAVQPNLFVEHRGGASFGSIEKQNAIARNGQILTKRYPNFDKSVQDFMARDPLRTVRLIVACAGLSATQKQIDIYIGHSLGGGAELYLKEKIEQNKASGKGSIVLRVGGPLRWRVEAHLPHGTVFGDTDDTRYLAQILGCLKNPQIIYSCAVGDRDPLSLPRIILELKAKLNARLKFLVHDFFVLSPSYCLLDADGVFRPQKVANSDDPAHKLNANTKTEVGLKSWQAAWYEALKIADQIECFSQNSSKILVDVFPDLEPRITVVPHQVSPLRCVEQSGASGSLTLGVLGDIGPQKGAECVARISKELSKDSFSKLAVVGRIDPRFSLSERSLETGEYIRADITRLAEQHAISAWLIPSIWPETFSYTTHEALATGLPVFSFDIGAQSEAVQAASNGHLIPLKWVNQPAKILSHMKKALEYDAIHRRLGSDVETSRNRSSAA